MRIGKSSRARQGASTRVHSFADWTINKTEQMQDFLLWKSGRKTNSVKAGCCRAAFRDVSSEPGFAAAVFAYKKTADMTVSAAFAVYF